MLEGFEEEIDWSDEKWEEYSVKQILAIVRKNNLKQKARGKGKDGGKGKGPRKCYECDSEDHIAANCPVRAERIKIEDRRDFPGTKRATRKWRRAKAPERGQGQGWRQGQGWQQGQVQSIPDSGTGTLERAHPSASQARRGWAGIRVKAS